MRIVCDTNVLVSGVLGRGGPPGRILTRVEQGVDTLFCTLDLVEEFAAVVARPKIRRPLEGKGITALDVVRWLASHCLQVDPFPLESVVVPEDPADDAVLACAATVRPDFIVSGDQHLLALGTFEGIPIVSPAKYLQKSG